MWPQPRWQVQAEKENGEEEAASEVSGVEALVRANLTTPATEVWATLNNKLRGHYQYYGVNDNGPWLMRFRRVAVRLVLRWLRRRSQTANMSYADFENYLTRHPLVSPHKLLNLIALVQSTK